MPRPKLHDAALRVRLLDRAGALVSAQGLGALSLRTLAADVGTSTTAVYALFGGKPRLLAALLDVAHQRLDTHLAAVVPGADPVEDLVRLALAYREGALAEPHLYDVMFGGVSEAAPTAAIRPFAALVERARAGGSLRSGAATMSIATALWATVHGLVSLELHALVPSAAGEGRPLFEVAVRALLSGWGA